MHLKCEAGSSNWLLPTVCLRGVYNNERRENYQICYNENKRYGEVFCLIRIGKLAIWLGGHRFLTAA